MTATPMTATPMAATPMTDQEKNKLEQTSNGKFDKNHERLGRFNQHKS